MLYADLMAADCQTVLCRYWAALKLQGAKAVESVGMPLSSPPSPHTHPWKPHLPLISYPPGSAVPAIRPLSRLQGATVCVSVCAETAWIGPHCLSHTKPAGVLGLAHDPGGAPPSSLIPVSHHCAAHILFREMTACSSVLCSLMPGFSSSAF